MQRRKSKSLDHLDKSWSLFLDRDGVINERLMDDYVKLPEEFRFEKDVPVAIKKLSAVFGRIFVVTNQQGIGKGLMTEEQLNRIHQKMLQGIEEKGGRIDKIYFCPDLKDKKPNCRKPEVSMGLQARKEYSDVELKKAVMVGDTRNDMIFGRRLGMITVLIGDDKEAMGVSEMIDYRFDHLINFAKSLTHD